MVDAPVPRIPDEPPANEITVLLHLVGKMPESSAKHIFPFVLYARAHVCVSVCVCVLCLNWAHLLEYVFAAQPIDKAQLFFVAILLE